MNAGQKYVQLSPISYFRLFLTFCTMGICHIKVRIFWEDHEKWKMGQIFVPFSEYPNFTLEKLFWMTILF